MCVAIVTLVHECHTGMQLLTKAKAYAVVHAGSKQVRFLA